MFEVFFLFLFSSFFFHRADLSFERLLYKRRRGGGNIQVFCSRNYSEVIPLRGITGSLVECRPRIDREKDEGREGTEVDILADVFSRIPAGAVHRH